MKKSPDQVIIMRKVAALTFGDMKARGFKLNRALEGAEAEASKGSEPQMSPGIAHLHELARANLGIEIEAHEARRARIREGKASSDDYLKYAEREAKKQ